MSNIPNRHELEEKILENLPLSPQEQAWVAADSSLSALGKEMAMIQQHLKDDPRARHLSELTEEDWASWQQGLNERIDKEGAKVLRPAFWRKPLVALGPLVAAAAGVFIWVQAQKADTVQPGAQQQAAVSQVVEGPQEAALSMDFLTDEEALALAEVFVEDSAPRSGSRG